MYVETDFSRSNIASTYSGLTAPASTRSWPASLIASSLLVAAPGTLIWDKARMSLIASSLADRLWWAGSLGGRRAVRVRRLQLLDDRVVLGAAHEVVDGDVLGRGGHALRPLRQILVGDDEVDVVVEVPDRLVGDGDVIEPRLLDLVAEHRGTHRARAHAGVAGEDDGVDRLPVRPGLVLLLDGLPVGLDLGGLVALVTGQNTGDRALLALHGLHRGRGLGQIGGLLAAGLEQDGADDEGRRRRQDHREDHAHKAAARGLRQHGDDRPGSGRRAQAGVEDGQGADADHAAGDRAQQEDRLGQDVGEVDLVDAAEELDHRRGRSGAPGQAGAED